METCAQQPTASHCPDDQAVDTSLPVTLAGVFLLLRALQTAVDDMRAKLSAKHKELYTVDEIAAMVGRSAFTVRRWVSEGRIEAIRVEGTGPRGRLLIPHDQLHKLVAGGRGSRVPAAVVG